MAAIAAGPTWNATKERVRRWADRDRALRPISSKVLGFVLERLNRRAGYDWHTARAIADDLGQHVGAVEKAFGELVAGGYLLRDRESLRGRQKGAAWRWGTTIPALLTAADEIARGRSGEPTQEIPEEPVRKFEEPTQERAIEPIEEPVEGISLPLPPKRARPARGVERGGISSSSLQGVDHLLTSARTKPEWANAVAILIEPVLRQLRIDAPDPDYVVTEVAKWATEAGLSATMLKAAAHRILETRAVSVRLMHFVQAVRECQDRVGFEITVDRPGAKAVAPDGSMTITAGRHPEAFAAWLAYQRSREKLGKFHKVEMMERLGFLQVPTMFPPGAAPAAP